ncbi:putative 1-phosphatidylinositol-3-phosphate 5-kinase FAB1D [Henckelia pumila]|uniref:putative 1-phosphatidylinositol-3-phosphate 5-kinase FAB1D n=1 Tax=Henckelia pumila TaxID=405737 RepID=UPI003C6DBC8F
MCHYCGAHLPKSSNYTDQENRDSSNANCAHLVQFCKFCVEKTYKENFSSEEMPSISPSGALRSSDSSVSSCSDVSVDPNFSDSGSIEISRLESFDTSTKRHEGNSNLPVNGKHDIGEVSRNLETAEIGEVRERANDPVETVSSLVDDGSGKSLSDEVDTEFWLPPEPEDQEDDLVGSVANYDDDDDECGDGGAWATTSSLSGFGEESSGTQKFKEEKLKAMNDVRNGMFKALVSQLIKSADVDPCGNYCENWVDIVTSLSWEAAAFVKPAEQKGTAMDPDGHVKLKCIATGSRNQSRVVKGLVFKKHAAHKHMQTRYKNPRLLLIHGSLDLSSGGLSSFDSMQQEKNNLKSIVEMIDMYHPNVILVEKSVSRDIQESILAKGITLVFDMKLHRLERVARCIGSPILSSEVTVGQKLRQCDSFHIEKFVEELVVSTEAGKKPSKTLMFLDGCPTRLGCTILLMGANSDELKRIKCVVRCAVVMAYHLILETSFLIDQRAMFSTISPCEVVDLALTNNKLISVGYDKTSISSQNETDAKFDTSSALDIPISDGVQGTGSHNSIPLSEENSSSSFEPYSTATFPGLTLSTSIQKVMDDSFPCFSDSSLSTPSSHNFNGRNEDGQSENDIQIAIDSDVDHGDTKHEDRTEGDNLLNHEQSHLSESPDAQNLSDSAEDQVHNKDEISSVLDSESILVLMSSRNASRGTVCEQSHFSHIKFYRSFDVPLGIFLRDNLLRLTLQCKTCGEFPEAHFYYYAHHNKQLTIQVRRLPAERNLPGETEGKLWMWSRCGQCKLHDGSSKSTKRVLISSDARGLSFGKFLELSFSNQSSFCSLSSCGHSFDKDFIYFFGLGPMVAMFKYSPVATFSVSLPPQKLEFSCSVRGEFLNRDSEDVYLKGISMFRDIEGSLKDIGTRYAGVSLNIQGSSKEFSDIVEMLKQEKSQFEVDIKDSLKNGSEGDNVCKFLSLNRLRMELLLESCLWDQRLHALLSSDLKMVDTESIKLQSTKQLLQEDAISGEGPGTAEIAVENSDSPLENTSGAENKFDISNDSSEFPIEDIQIRGPVEGSKEDNPCPIDELDDKGSAVPDILVKPTSEDYVDDVNINSREDNFDKTVPIATEVESTGADANSSLKGNHNLSVSSNLEDDRGWIWAPFSDIRREYMEDIQKGYLPRFESLNSYAAQSTAQKLIADEGSRLHIPLGSKDYIVTEYEDELSSIIACALTVSMDRPTVLEDLAMDARKERVMDAKSNGSSQSMTRTFSLGSPRWSSFGSSDSDNVLSPLAISSEDSHSSSFDGLDLLDSLFSYGSGHPQVSLGSGKSHGKRKYSVISIYASQFRQLRDRCCPSEIGYIASLSRCRNWDAKGGKSKSFFAKTLDDRLIIKEIQRTEFDSFMKFAPNYFEYMNQCYELGNQTCLAKIFGIYQVVVRAKNGKEVRHDLLVMENLSFGRHIARQYDLKGALHARFTATDNGSRDVLLDQNFVNDMNVSPLYVSRRSKRNLQRAVYNDTHFLNSINVMDYSLLVGVDTQGRKLVCGIIDYLRQYTWDKQIENWVKSSLVVPKNHLPTVISPKEYKKRFRKFINTHFLSVPDHWCSRRSKPCKLCGPVVENGL